MIQLLTVADCSERLLFLVAEPAQVGSVIVCILRLLGCEIQGQVQFTAFNSTCIHIWLLLILLVNSLHIWFHIVILHVATH